MIYVTGDLHGPAGLERLECWSEGREGDFLIFAGDFGYPWDYSEIECDEIVWLESLPYKVLFVDGNHERFGHWEDRPAESCVAAWFRGCATARPSMPIPGLPDERLTRFLDEVDWRLDYKHWYYGHFHKDVDVDEKHTLLFERIVPIGEGVGN